MSDGSFSEFFTSLPAPLAITGVIAAACAYAVARAVLDRRKPEARSAVAQEGTIGQQPVPLWAMMGPVHEVMQTVHDMAEESRKQSAALADIARTARDIEKGTSYTHRLLEELIRDREMDPSAPPPHHQRRSK